MDGLQFQNKLRIKNNASTNLVRAAFLRFHLSTCRSGSPVALRSKFRIIKNQVLTNEDLTCSAGRSPIFQTSTPPPGPAAPPGSACCRLEMSSLHSHLFPDIPSHDPRGLNTLCSRISLSSTRPRASGKGMRRWWNCADSGRDSKSFQVMFGGSQMEGDQKAAEMDVIATGQLI